MRYQGQKWALIRCRASVARQLADLRPELHNSTARLADGSRIVSLGDVVEYLLDRRRVRRPKGVVTTPASSPIIPPGTPKNGVPDQAGPQESET